MNHSKAYKCLDRRDCEQIRVFSRRSWEKHALQCERSATTYAAEHPQKTLDEPTAGRARPCSPTRRHRPHPTRSLYAIKELPHNPQTTGKASLSENTVFRFDFDDFDIGGDIIADKDLYLSLFLLFIFITIPP
ncbi:hypothetical protein QQF64_020344 [Cirrhinus molitorella]|uniref:Uncharacterized protein n=1 Tax=Cirrhinus molitorella TaxID=172907 RepID=A0ABR3LCE7_9TELE